MISAANLLVYAHRIRLDHDDTDKMVISRMNKRFMERARYKEDFTSILFHGILSDEHVSANDEWNY